LVLRDRVAKVETFPMGIDFDTFSQKAAHGEALRRVEEDRRPLGDSRNILSSDRLGYTKGTANRLLASPPIPEANPSGHGQTVRGQAGGGGGGGEEGKRRIAQLVGGSNGRFGNLRWTPVVCQYKPLAQEQLVPLCRASDVMLVTPLRDGMNLVAKEYVACRPD